MLKVWIEAIRPKTLPVSVAGVITGSAYAVVDDCFLWMPAVLCLAFAVLAQIASNFANEYYDYKAGLDRKGRVGPRRGVTEGDITPRNMLCATYVTLIAAAVVGLTLIHWGGWILVPIGAFIIVGALAYSTGPYPLSRHCLGEVAVVVFFGIIPVCLTYWLMSLVWSIHVFCGSLAIGLAGANVLVINNYRDMDDDRAVGKHTLPSALGRRYTLWLYRLNWIVSAVLLYVSDRSFLWIGAAMLVCGLQVERYVRCHTGASLNNALRYTALITLATAVASLVVASV